jgi:hypothetical protein
MSIHPLQTRVGLTAGLLDWLVANSLPITILVLALLALLLLLVALRLFRQSQQPTALRSGARPVQSRRKAAAAKKRDIAGWTLSDLTGQVIPLQPLPFSIGREADNTLVLDDQSVAAHHANILYDPAWGCLVVEDLDSPSGILIEGQPTRKNLLQAGVHLTVGRYNFTLDHQVP